MKYPGLGSRLLDQLGEVARQTGITSHPASTTQQNKLHASALARGRASSALLRWSSSPPFGELTKRRAKCMLTDVVVGGAFGLSAMQHARKGASHGTEGRMDGVRVANGGAARVFRPTDPQLRSMSGLASAEVAHAIKHPLIALRWRLEDSHKKPLGRGQLQEIIDTCISELDLMVAMFDAVLDMAYIESGCLKSRFTPVNLQSVLSKLVDVYEPVVQDAGQSLVVSCDSVKEAWLKGDQHLLFLIFNNLIENAIRYCPAETTISINLTRKPGSLVVSIGDNGSGLSAEDRERVFRPFFRVEPTRNTHGHGLGIPLAAAIVRLHGGSIVLRDNAPGLRAVVHLPKLRIRHDCHPSAHPVDRPK